MISWTHLFTFCWVFLECVGLYILSLSFFKVRRNNFSIVLAVAVVALLLSVLSYLDIPQIIRVAANISIFTVFCLFTTNSKPIPSIFVSLFLVVIGAAFDSLISTGYCAASGISIDALMQRKITYIVVVTTAKLTAILFYWVLFQLRSRGGRQRIKNRYFYLSLLFPATSYLAMYMVFRGASSSEDAPLSVAVFGICLTIANVGILYLISIIEKEAKKETEMALMQKQIDMQMQSYTALELNYRTQRKMTHEFERHIQTLQSLMDRQEYDAANQYVQNIQRNRALKIVSVNSGHPVIDAILNEKHQVAQENDVKIQIEVNDLSNVSIQTDKLVILLSNLLDNALEACFRVNGRKEIRCKIIYNGDLYVAVRNTSQHIEIVDGHIATTKSSATDHGYGIPAIRYVLDELDAEYTFDYSDGWFRFVSEIPASPI